MELSEGFLLNSVIAEMELPETFPLRSEKVAEAELHSPLALHKCRIIIGIFFTNYLLLPEQFAITTPALSIAD